MFVAIYFPSASTLLIGACLDTDLYKSAVFYAVCYCVDIDQLSVVTALASFWLEPGVVLLQLKLMCLQKMAITNAINFVKS
jgi:hypothetical protein